MSRSNLAIDVTDEQVSMPPHPMDLGKRSSRHGTPDLMPGFRCHRLVVIQLLGLRDNGRIYLCRCDCGREIESAHSYLARHIQKSCGCLRAELMRGRRAPTTRTHGATGTRAYIAWAGMTQRCTNPNEANFKNYGGRGIKVCDRWKTFANFLQDMGQPPEGMSIDRIDVNGDYEPGNCRWATRAEQATNTRRNRRLTVFGETKCVVEWLSDPRCRATKPCMQWRLKAGWDLERAITTPSQREVIQ